MTWKWSNRSRVRNAILEFIWRNATAKHQWQNSYIIHSDLGTWTEGEITVTNRHIKIMISCTNNNALHICNVRKSPTEKPKYLFPSCSWHFSGKCYMFPPQLTRLTVINKRRIVHPQMEYTYFPDIFCAIHIRHRHSCSLLVDTLWFLKCKSHCAASYNILIFTKIKVKVSCS